MGVKLENIWSIDKQLIAERGIFGGRRVTGQEWINYWSHIVNLS